MCLHMHGHLPGMYLSNDVRLALNQGGNEDETDIEIAQECTMEPITAIAEKAGIPDEYLEQYGKYKAKIDYNFLKKSRTKMAN